MAMPSEILRWLKKPKVLRLLCLALSVVGLLCYALSSSFNHLLGNWSWWKVLLYTVFSFIISIAVLFAPARSSSTSLRLESHVAFLVLIITSVYSFLFDNFVKSRPDAYILVSCAAFAIMSLTLANLTQFGFQIDLLYFFCGGLIVQLMKIKMWLVIVGGGFSYSLLQLCNYPRHTQGENLPLQVQNQVNIQFDPRSVSSSRDTQGENFPPQVQNQVNVQVNDSGSVSISSHEEANAHVDSTLGTSPEDGDLRFQDHVLALSNSPSQDGSVDDGLIIRQQLRNCIKELEEENQMLVPMFCRHIDKYLTSVLVDPEEVPDPDVNLVMDALPSEIIGRLKETVKLMVDAGFEEECSDIYSKWRREFLEYCLRELGLQFQTPNNEDVEKWLKTCKAAAKIVFPNEGRLCYYLFSGRRVATGVSFEKVCKELMIGLLSFVDTTITMGSYSPNLLFNIVPNMSKSLDELLLEFTSQILFHKPSFLRDFEDIEQILDMLNRFGDIIYPDNVQAPVTNGGLHLITKESMDFIHRICEGKQRDGQTSRIENSSFWVVIERMVELLESELEAKSGYYFAPALGCVFMMNNLIYIEQKMLDFRPVDDSFRKKVEENCTLYLRRSWNKIVEFLKVEINESAEHNMVARSMVRKRLKLFNRHFEETCTIQSTWTVSDKQLRKRIVQSIEAFLLPQYEIFCDRIGVGFGISYYIKFGIVDIQNYLNYLFLRDEEMTPEDKITV